MAEQKTYTQAGFDALQKELDYLITVKREENKKEISTARAYGDLSENSEYDEAKQEQAKIHARIDELQQMIANAKVVDESQIDESVISVGSIVVVESDKLGKKTYHIVGSYETDPKNGKISDASPIGLALIGAREGDTVIANIAKGSMSLKVVSVTRYNA